MSSPLTTPSHRPAQLGSVTRGRRSLVASVAVAPFKARNARPSPVAKLWTSPSSLPSRKALRDPRSRPGGLAPQAMGAKAALEGKKPRRHVRRAPDSGSGTRRDPGAQAPKLIIEPSQGLGMGDKESTRSERRISRRRISREGEGFWIVSKMPVSVGQLSSERTRGPQQMGVFPRKTGGSQPSADDREEISARVIASRGPGWAWTGALQGRAHGLTADRPDGRAGVTTRGRFRGAAALGSRPRARAVRVSRAGRPTIVRTIHCGRASGNRSQGREPAPLPGRPPPVARSKCPTALLEPVRLRQAVRLSGRNVTSRECARFRVDVRFPSP
jgi:hypothetical protein